jgi:hypothetical protein
MQPIISLRCVSLRKFLLFCRFSELQPIISRVLELQPILNGDPFLLFGRFSEDYWVSYFGFLCPLLVRFAEFLVSPLP